MGRLWFFVSGSVVRTTAATALLMLISFLSQGACDLAGRSIKYSEISYTNDTSEVLFVHFNMGHGGSFRLNPGETQSVAFALPRSGPEYDVRYDDQDDPVYIDIYDEDGCRALLISTTVRKIREDHRSFFTITSSDLKPPESRYYCYVDPPAWLQPSD